VAPMIVIKSLSNDLSAELSEIQASHSNKTCRILFKMSPHKINSSR